MKKGIKVARILFLVLFILLVRRQTLMLWLALYAVSLLFPLLFGKRIYCMAVCPIHTVMLGAAWLKGKLGRQDRPAPAWLKSGWLAWTSLGLSVAVYVVSRRVLERDFPLMILWIAVSAVMTLFFHGDVFHDLVCPYGVLQRLLAKVSIRSEQGKKAARDYRGFSVSVMGGGKQGGGADIPRQK